MALPAVNILRRQGVYTLLRPRPGRGAFALRLALVCTLTTLLTIWFRTPEAAVAAYVVFFMNKEDRTSSIIGSAGLMVVGTVVIGLVLGLSQLVLEDSALRVACMGLISLTLLWLVSASKLRPIGGTLALVVAFSLDLLGSIPVGEAATRGLLYGWLLIGIPAAASLLLNLLVGAAPRKLLQSALARYLRIVADALAGDASASKELAEVQTEAMAPCRLWLQRMKLERVDTRADIQALECAIEHTLALSSLVNYSLATTEARLPQTQGMALQRTLYEMADIFADGAYPTEIEFSLPDQTSPCGMAQAILLEIRAVLENFCQDFQAVNKSSSEQTPRAGFFEADAFSNPVHVHYALKTTGAAMFCYALYSLLDWPGIHTAMLTCYAVSLATVGETVEKLRLRIGGCLYGAAMGLTALVWVNPHLTSATSYLLLVFAGTFLCAWVAVGSERIAYAGFQMALAFFMCVIQGAGPGQDMVVARDRIIGILLGNTVAYLVATRFWPVSVRKNIDAGMAQCVILFRQMLFPSQTSKRLTLLAQMQQVAAAVEIDIHRAQLEPAGIRPNANWLNACRQFVSKLAALSPVFLIESLSTRALPAGVDMLAPMLQRQFAEVEVAWSEVTTFSGDSHASS